MEEGEGSLLLSTINTKPTLKQHTSPSSAAKYQTTTTTIITATSTTTNDNNCWHLEDIVLTRNESGLGFTITGGVDSVKADLSDTAIYITKIMAGSAAALDGRLHVNDCIISVNDFLITDVSHATAVETLNNAGNLVRLSIKRKRSNVPQSEPTQLPSPPPLSIPAVNAAEAAAQQSPRRKAIELRKTNGRFGFSISGGVGNQQRFGDNGIFVTRILEGGPADMNGQLSIGDRLISVRCNDIETNLENVSHDTAVDSLMSVDTVTIVVDKDDFDS